MIVLPKAALTRVDECSPGDLVRIPSQEGGQARISLVTQTNEAEPRKLIIPLESDKETPAFHVLRGPFNSSIEKFESICAVELTGPPRFERTGLEQLSYGMILNTPSGFELITNVGLLNLRTHRITANPSEMSYYPAYPNWSIVWRWEDEEGAPIKTLLEVGVKIS